MKIVRLENNQVVEIIPDYALPVIQWYGEAFASQCVEAPDEVAQRWTYDPESSMFLPPEPEPEPQPTAEEMLSQTAANLTVENSSLKSQVQTLAQAVAMMQIGG